MDHLHARFSNVKNDYRTLRQSLKAAKIAPSLKYDEDGDLDQIRFSVKVGPHQQLWLIRLYAQDGSLTISGGVTKTFFGHNLWVLNNEGQQLRAILKIVIERLSELDGIRLPSTLDTVTVERVELTNHHVLPEDVGQREAIHRLKNVFNVLAPNRVANWEATLDDHGCAAIGSGKSSKECRIYDPTWKFRKAPAGVPAKSWDALTAACAGHLRVEMIMSKREIDALDMQKIEAWDDHEKIQTFLAKKYQRYGLSVAYETTWDALTPKEVFEMHPTFVEPARYWFTAGERGAPLNKRHGSANRFRLFMLEHGFNINVPFERNKYLAHGLHDVLRHDNRASIPEVVRNDEVLFAKWWKHPRK